MKYILILFILIYIPLNKLYADDTEIFTVRVDPNILIIMDNSGSMNEVIYHKNYSPFTTYAGNFTSGSIYRMYHSDYQFMNYTANGKTISLLYGPGDDNWGVRYNGNYLNWIFWHATDEEISQLSTQSNKTRIQVAKEVLTYLINNTNGVRFGLMQFDTASTDHGGMLLAECGSSKEILLNAVGNLRAITWTPLSETMIEAWDYFRGSNKSYYRNAKYNSPIQYYCQKNFIILVTDGEPTKDWTFPDWVLPAIEGRYDSTPQSGNSGFPYYLDGVAWYLNNTDARNNLVGLQNISTYTIGFNSDHPLLKRTAEKGGGSYFIADNKEQLINALESVLNEISLRSYSFTSPSVPAVRTIYGNYVYITSFEPNETPFWKGYAKAYRLEKNGTLKVDESGNPSPESLIWDAGEKLVNISSTARNIKTYINGNMKAFTIDNINNNDLGITDNTLREKIIAHIRGTDPFDIDYDGLKDEERAWKLGDIFHSNPVIVGSPSKFFIDEGYNGPGGFYERNKKRTKIIIVGANDGMLHAFNGGNWDESIADHDEGTGIEEWAFIPPSILKNLKLMISTHTFYVDSSPKVADVWFDNNNNGVKDVDEWRTVIICGLRKGGKHYFALDITDTKDPKFMWEFPSSVEILSKLGESWSEPAIGKVKLEGKEKWVAFIGGGFDPNENRKNGTSRATVGKGLFIIDIKTGSLIKEISGIEGMNYSFPSPPAAVDINLDGFIDKVYIGDLAGQMWVFDVSSEDIANWTGKRLFVAPATPTEKHPIYYQPAVAFDQNKIPWVYFGTGDRENPNDSTNPPERFYAIKDDGQGVYPRREENLKDLIGLGENTFTKVVDPYKGWFIKLDKTDGKHEKVLAKPAVFSRLVYFTTYSFKQTNDPCKVSGDAKLYIIEYQSGGGAILVNDYSDLLGTASDRSKIIGEGIPSSPVISVNMDGEASIIVGTTSGQIFSQKVFSPNKKFFYWREVIQ